MKTTRFVKTAAALLILGVLPVMADDESKSLESESASSGQKANNSEQELSGDKELSSGKELSGDKDLSGGKELPVQSKARPFGLDIVSPVYQAGSDEASREFQAKQLPALLELVNTRLSESRALKDITALSLDPAKLTMVTDAEVRVYFVGEGAGYHNTLGFNVDATGPFTGTPELIFPDASSRDSWYAGGDKSSEGRDKNNPLLPGDFVNLGTIGKGQTLDFFLLADAATNANKNLVWTADSKYNSDGIQHIVSFAIPNSPYLLLSFEDLRGGGDRDYNDVVVAVNIGYNNVQALANPEPHVILTFGLLAVAAFVVRRRRGACAAIPA